VSRVRKLALAPVLAIGALGIGLAYAGAFVAFAMAGLERKIDETFS
jgi:hypothetical protein